MSERTVQQWTQDIRVQEKAEAQAKAWDLWLNCRSYREIAAEMDVDDKTISAWCAEKAQSCANSAPDPHMAFDVWSGSDAGHHPSPEGRSVPGLPADGKGSVSEQTPGGPQRVWYVTEGLGRDPLTNRTSLTDRRI